MAKKRVMKRLRALVPTSNASNAYDLLTDVIAAVREERRRLYMPNYLVPDVKKILRRKGPACNTAACVGGWIVLLKDGKSRALRLDHGNDKSRLTDIPDRAAEILGIGLHEIGGLFSGDVYGGAIDRDRTGEQLKYGTKDYVDAVVARIARFQGKFEDRLRKQTV